MRYGEVIRKPKIYVHVHAYFNNKDTQSLRNKLTNHLHTGYIISSSLRQSHAVVFNSLFESDLIWRQTECYKIHHNN